MHSIFKNTLPFGKHFSLIFQTYRSYQDCFACMYTKEELESMAVPELMGIANELGIKVKQDDSLESVVYAILDKAAENSAAGGVAPKKKRTRIQKKDTSRVYTVTGQDGENLDSVKKRKPVEIPPLFNDLPVANAQEETPAPEETPVVKPKRRGRKSKAELAAEAAAAEEAQKQAEAAAAEVIETAAEPESVMPEEGPADFVPEEAYFAGNAEEAGEEQLQMMEQLKQKLERGHEYHPSEEPEAENDDVWEGDPGDGTDFITVLDIPIEDQAAIPTLDIFAIKFNNKMEKVIKVQGTNHGDSISVSVRDYGVGIRPQDVARIFEPFYQVDDYFTGQVSGWGLGLPMVKYAVELHGGTVSVVSDRGLGSIFTINFPIPVANNG